MFQWCVYPILYTFLPCGTKVLGLWYLGIVIWLVTGCLPKTYFGDLKYFSISMVIKYFFSSYYYAFNYFRSLYLLCMLTCYYTSIFIFIGWPVKVLHYHIINDLKKSLGVFQIWVIQKKKIRHKYLIHFSNLRYINLNIFL